MVAGSFQVDFAARLGLVLSLVLPRPQINPSCDVFVVSHQTCRFLLGSRLTRGTSRVLGLVEFERHLLRILLSVKASLTSGPVHTKDRI